MFIGERLREIREAKKLSQRDIEKRCGLMRCYISRVENGHTIPTVETLGKMAQALNLPLYQIFYEQDSDPHAADVPPMKGKEQWGSVGKNARYLRKLTLLMPRIRDDDRAILLGFAKNMTKEQRSRHRARTQP